MMDKRYVFWGAILMTFTLIVAACTPAETSADPPLAPEGSETMPETVAPSSPSPFPTQAAVTETVRPPATPPPLTVEIIPDPPTKPAKIQVTRPVPDSPTAVAPDGYLEGQVNRAKTDLAQRTGIDKEEISLVEFHILTWPDGSLGCPEPGVEYAQVLQEGYLIMLQAGLGIYSYHGGGYPDAGPFLCEGIGSKIIVPPPAGGLGDT